MREKIQKFITLTFGDFDKMVEGFCEQYRGGFKMALGVDVLPAEVAEAIALVGKTQMATRDDILTRVVEICQTHFTEEQLDGLIAFQESEIGKHYDNVQPKMQNEVTDAVNEWMKKAFTGIETDLQRLLGGGEIPPSTPTPPEAPPLPPAA